MPKENLGVPDAAAVPKRPPVAGAVLVVLLDAAPEELGVPKLNDMAIGVGDALLVRIVDGREVERREAATGRRLPKAQTRDASKVSWRKTKSWGGSRLK